MSLFGSIQLAGNTLQAVQVGLQVVGNNIANANTPGFIREEVVYSPAPVQRQGRLILGLGVEVDGIVQRADRFLQERLRNATSDRTGAEVSEKAYADLELILGELSDTDLSTSFSSFFSAVDDVLNDNSNLSVRNLAVLQGRSLTQDINRIYSRVDDLFGRLDTRVEAIAGEINNLAEEVRNLNLQITTIEGGGLSGSQAGGLRTQRDNAVSRLANLVDIRVSEQPNGSITVSLGGDFLVVDGIRREVAANDITDGVRGPATIRFVDLNSPLTLSSGELQGLYTARDGILGGFLTDLDDLAGTLTFEFNKLFSQGQGLAGFDQVTSQEPVFDVSAPLDAAGLAFTPENGSFDLLVYNTNTQVTETNTIRVDLNGLDDDTSLTDLVSQLGAIQGITASITPSGALTIATDATDTQFAFARDSSGLLAAIGINTFFTGSTASGISVNNALNGIGNAARFAASLGGIGADAQNAEQLAEFFSRSLDGENGASLAERNEQLVNTVTQGATVAQAVADGLRVFEATLEGENQAFSAVNIDEEAIRMITLQRTFQASARFIQTITELLDTLINL